MVRATLAADPPQFMKSNEHRMHSSVTRHVLELDRVVYRVIDRS
ncbi:MAG TPA: hypothetical protein VFT55_08525 [Planctomycetota bacterium]|nr:hypothetical protein [Planctomycetota bacterium]